jgi:UDP-glucose 4-epimerase
MIALEEKQQQSLVRPFPPRRVLVTGGAGFIGANLIRLLLDRGCHVTVLDNLSSGRHEHLDGLPVEFIHGDVLDSMAALNAVAGQNGIVHLAAQTGVPGSLKYPRRDCEINVLGTLTLLEVCKKERERRQAQGGAPGPRFVFASSNAPLGRQSPPATEDKAPLPISPYGASKLAGEAYCLAYNGAWGLDTIVLRFGNVYGPFSTHKGSVVAKFLQDILAGRNLVIDGDGQQTRDFIYVGDLCRAILMALESNVCGEIFQVATGTETTIDKLTGLLKRAAQLDVSVKHGPARQADIRQNYSAIEKIRRMLGWEPQIELQKGLEMTAQWFLERSDASKRFETTLR